MRHCDRAGAPRDHRIVSADPRAHGRRAGATGPDSAGPTHIVAAGGLLTGQAWWRTAAVAAADLSLVVIALFPYALPAGSRIGAVVVNVAVLGGLLVLGWPATSSVGA